MSQESEILFHFGSCNVTASLFDPDELPITTKFPTHLSFPPRLAVGQKPTFHIGDGKPPGGKQNYFLYPVTQGTVTDFGLLKKLVNHAMQAELGDDQPYEQQVVLVDSYHATRENRAKMMKMLLKKALFPAATIVPQELLIACSLVATSEYKLVGGAGASVVAAAGSDVPSAEEEVTALVVDFGLQQIRVVPVIQGRVHSYAARVLNYGAQQLNLDLRDRADLYQVMNYRSSSDIPSFTNTLLARNCYARLEGAPEPEVTSSDLDMFVQPLVLRAELHECTEMLFKGCIRRENAGGAHETPHGTCYAGNVPAEYNIYPPYPGVTQDAVVESDATPLQDVIRGVLQKCPRAFRPLLAKRVILSGGLAKLRNLPQRLLLELKKAAPSYDFCCVVYQDPRSLQTLGLECIRRTWNQQSKIYQNVVTASQYEEMGDAAFDNLWNNLYVTVSSDALFQSSSEVPAHYGDCSITFH